MKFRVIFAALVVCLATAAVCFAADDAFTGTWKLNEAKSKIPSGSMKNHTVVYEAAGENTKVTVDGTGPDGKATHSEWTGKFDGKEYAVTGDSPDTMRSVKKVNDHTLEITGKKDGKVVLSGKIVVSPDGKTRTVTITSNTPDGKKSTSTAVYDKQ